MFYLNSVHVEETGKGSSESQMTALEHSLKRPMRHNTDQRQNGAAGTEGSAERAQENHRLLPNLSFSPSGLCFGHVSAGNRDRSTEKTTHPHASTARLPSFLSTAHHPDSGHRGICSNKRKWEVQGRLHFNDQRRIPSDTQSKGERWSFTLTLERRPQ